MPQVTGMHNACPSGSSSRRCTHIQAAPLQAGSRTTARPTCLPKPALVADSRFRKPRQAAQRASRRRHPCRAARASLSATETTPEPAKARAGWSLLAFLINAAFQIPPLYRFLMSTAKRSMIRTAERNGIPWHATVQELQANSQLQELQQRIANPDVTYPDYYKLRFHSYQEGNLGWLPAFEAAAGTDDMALRAMGYHLTPTQAQDGLRHNANNAIQSFIQRHCNEPTKDILDVGCSIGVSTRYLAQAFPQARNVVGLDLSSYFLAVAELRSREAAERGEAWPQRVSFLHAAAEANGLSAGSFDLVNFGFIMHECPPAAVAALLNEARRLLRPGGTVAITDNDPGAKHRQEAKPAHVMVLLKVIEPWEADFIGMDLEGALSASGFRHVNTHATDSRHRTVLAQAI